MKRIAFLVILAISIVGIRFDAIVHAEDELQSPLPKVPLGKVDESNGDFPVSLPALREFYDDEIAKLKFASPLEFEVQKCEIYEEILKENQQELEDRQDKLMAESIEMATIIEETGVSDQETREKIMLEQRMLEVEVKSIDSEIDSLQQVVAQAKAAAERKSKEQELIVEVEKRKLQVLESKYNQTEQLISKGMTSKTSLAPIELDMLESQAKIQTLRREQEATELEMVKAAEMQLQELLTRRENVLSRVKMSNSLIKKSVGLKEKSLELNRIQRELETIERFQRILLQRSLETRIHRRYNQKLLRLVEEQIQLGIAARKEEEATQRKVDQATELQEAKRKVEEVARIKMESERQAEMQARAAQLEAELARLSELQAKLLEQAAKEELESTKEGKKKP